MLLSLSFYSENQQMVNQSQNALQELQQLCMVSTGKLIQNKRELGTVQHRKTTVSFSRYHEMSLQTFLKFL